MESEIKKFKTELQDIIDSLEWFGFDNCPNCKSSVKFSILDSDEGAICPKCKKITIWGDLFPSHCEIYQEFFLSAMRESLRKKIDVTEDFRSSFIEVYTALEIFLQKLVESQFKKRNIDDKIIEFMLNEMRPDVRFYFRLFKVLDFDLDKESEKHIEKVREIQELRNKVVHKGYLPSEGEILRAFKRISRIFIILSNYSIF